MNSDSLTIDIREFLELWQRTFNRHTPDCLLALYTDDAILQGTSSAKLYIGAKEIATYFRGGASVKMGVWHSVTLAHDVVLVAGSYVFSQTSNGHQQSTPARFSFVLRRQDDTWKIVHHHSSANPTEPRGIAQFEH
ncbi:nuclear transport factor 2 family protein [Bradyrhizobium tropiciagri]|uniref:nuclear transport factor 2 family protein n=1 Tax=Bradyrhizobium tropiciagri TaxID=312253 RepID=UPI00067D285B|nr:nuclear transport factor 2 family protein [Bradyrhizobium tropiciagri]